MRSFTCGFDSLVAVRRTIEKLKHYVTIQIKRGFYTMELQAQRTLRSLKKSTLQVRILDQEIRIATDKTQAQVSVIAKYVEKIADELQRKTPGASALKIMSLTSIILAERLFDQNHEHEGFKGEIQARSEKILSLLEDATEI